MGLDYRALEFLGKTVFKPHKPKSCICLGRPHYFGVNKETLKLCSEFNLEVKPEMLRGGYRERFADEILKAFGVERLEHMDVFTGEGATVIHDLNFPIDRTLRNKFDLVIDNGTLEHVFNIPQAIENCAALCSLGGHVAVIAPANNFCGHGFFQFSPELFYRSFSEANGFAESQVTLFDYGIRNSNIPIVDPATRKSRLEFINGSQVLMAGVSKKISDKEPFWTKWPHQSDYVVYWNAVESRPQLEHRTPRFQVMLLNAFPRLARCLQGIKFSCLNPKMRLRSNG